MTEESLGTAALYLKVNTDGMDAGVAKAKRSQEDLAQAAARASQQFEQNSRRQIAALERSIAVFGKDQEAKLRWRIEQQTSGKVAEELNRKLDQQVASTRAAAEAQKQLAAAQERSNAIQAEATRRLQEESAQRERNWAKVRAQFADEQRLATMRANAAAAFGPQLAAQERLQAGLDREAGVRQRLATFLNTERGQRIASASAIGKEASAAAASGAAALGATKAFSGSAKTARELQFAMRGLPAQLTDIGVSLASGQKPMLVLLQQGGQLKDMFGGIRPAAQALGGAFLRMVNPATLAAAAVAALAIAWNQGEKDAAAFTNALLTTGNAAGRSVAQLEGMVGTLSELQGVTAGNAREAILQVAQSGRFAGEQFELVAEAAARMEAATGQSVDSTVKKFEELAKSPTEALLKLNETEHFLTEAQYARVRALEEEGRKQDAAADAARIYANRLDEIADAAEAARPHLTQMWDEVKQGASDAWEATKDFAEFLASAADKFRQRSFIQRFGYIGAFNSIRDLYNADPATRAQAAPVAGAVDSDQKRAAQEFDREGLRFATDRAKMERDIAEARKLGVQAGKSELEIEKRIAEIRESYARKGKKPAASLDNANARAALQAFQDQLKVEQGAITNQTQLLQAQYSARLVTVQKYYEDQRALTVRGTAAQEQAIQGQISVLRARNVTGKDAADVARQLATLEAELAKVRADGATKLAILNIQEADALKQRQLAAKAYQSALDENNAALQDQISTMVARISMGEREFEIQTRINEAYRDQAKELLALARQRDAGELDAETYEARVAALKEATDRQVQIVRDGYDRMAEAQANWANGAIKALKDYVEQAADVAGQTYSLFSDAFKGAEDVLTDFITKGKADWRGFLDDILAESTRFVVKQQLAKIAKRFMPGLGDGEGSQAGALSSAAGDLAASATPLYGAAAALSSAAAALAAAGTGGAEGAAGSTGGGGWLSAIFGGGGGSQGSIFDLFANDSFSYFAKGGAFAGGNVVPFASGGVVTRPTFFGMSGGRMGVMGEERPEAIVPLHKGPDGKLGIRMERDPMPQPLTAPVVNQVIQVQGLMGNHTPSQMARASAEAQSKALRKR